MKSEITVQEKTANGLDRNTLKYIAVAAMLIDHVAVAFVEYDSPLGTIMHIIGRTTGPIMFYFAVEGYHKTRSLARYMGRLAAFAAVSYLPYIYFRYDAVPEDMNYFRFSVIYTIFMGVAAVHARRTIKNPLLKALAVFALSVACIPADWGPAGVAIIVIFDLFYGSFYNQAVGYSLFVLFEEGLWGMFLRPFFGLVYDGALLFSDLEYYKMYAVSAGMFIPIILLGFYNGKKSKSGGDQRFSKWFFYIFYPAHMLLLGLIKSLAG